MDPKPPIRLVISDLDGTLLDDRKQLTPEAIDAVRQLKRVGIRFTFATGRVDRMTWHYARILDLDLPTITCNGALIKEPFGGAVYRREVLDDAMVRDLQAFALAEDLDLLIYTEEEVYQLPSSQRIKVFEAYNRDASAAGLEPVPIAVQLRVPDPGHDWHDRAVKMFIQYRADQRDLLVERLGTYPSIQTVQSDHGSLDVNNAGCSKGRAVRWLADQLGVPLSEVCCLGDQENDRDMIEAAGFGIAMGNAQPSVRAVADAVAPSHDRNGFADAIRRYVLHTVD